MSIFINETRKTTLATQGRIAYTLLARTKGLLFRKSLDAGEGLFISPCPSIHMFFMLFPIDVVFVDNSYKVVKVKSHLKPWRVCFGGRGAYSVFELPVGVIEATKTEIGDQLAIKPEE